MGEPLVQRAFSAGEVSPSYAARADLALYTRALRTLRNFLVQESGGASNRAGSRFLAAVKDSATRTYFIPVVFANELAYVVEAGDSYFRFYRLGARIESPPGTPYEIATPYVAAHLSALQFEQTGDVVTITHESYAPRELRTAGDTSWTLTIITTTPSIAAPGGLSGGFSVAGSLTLKYVVTSVKAETFEESLASGVVTLAGVADPTPTNPTTVSWSAVAGAAEYHVYKDPYQNGALGYIGRTSLTNFNDVGLLPDFNLTPPQARSLFAAVGNFPRAIGYYQQRRLFAGSTTDPETIWASRIGFHGNFSLRSPLQDDDAVTFRLASRKAQDVRFLIDLKRLLVMTTAGEWKINGDGEGGALIPTAINPDRQGYAGCALVRPAVIDNEVFFVQARGNRIRKLSFDQEMGGIGSMDVSAFARHLFQGKTIQRMALSVSPQPTLWCVRSDGVLLALTYIAEQEIVAWSRHDTGGSDLIEDVCTVPEGDEDGVYLLVKRTISGLTKRYVERLASRTINTLADDAWFVDSGLSYSGTAATVFSGLTHLVGRSVRVFADGVALPDTYTVSGAGSVTLPAAATKVRIGLPITAQMETLDVDASGSNVRDKQKTVNSVSVLVDQSARGFYVGPSADKLSLTRPESWDTSALSSDIVEARITATWNKTGRVLLQHTDPTPLNVLAIIPNVLTGG